MSPCYVPNGQKYETSALAQVQMPSLWGPIDQEKLCPDKPIVLTSGDSLVQIARGRRVKPEAGAATTYWPPGT